MFVGGQYRAITFQHLRALSNRRICAFEEAGWEVTQAYRAVNFFETLLDQAVAERAELTQQQAQAQGSDEPGMRSPDHAEDVPF